MFNRLWLVAIVLCLAAACSPGKKIAKNNDDDVVSLDTLTVTASRNNPYRGSADKDFDLVHTRLEVSFNYEKQYLYGKAAITLKPHFYPQNQLVLDAKQFDLLEVSTGTTDSRQPLAFKYDSLQITIQLDREYKRNEQLTVFIYYTAKPNERRSGGSLAITGDKGLYFINPLGKDSLKPVQIWTQGETESSSCWFPTIDKPNQKMTDEICITHLKKYVSLSNGSLVSSKDNGDSTVTDYWKMDLPHAPYLVMMAIGNFSIIKDHWRDVPVNYYVEPEYAPYAKQIFGNTPEMMEFFSQKLGFDYAWPQYAQIVVRDYVSGAMENTSATLHGEFLNRNTRQLLDENYEDVISHELFHQWFGDLVTLESWSNVPLNEAFATYGEYLWNEYKYGKEPADYKQLLGYWKYMDLAKDKTADLIRYYYEDREDMFDAISYEKGGLILNYLRNVVGDEAFFKSLELYLKNNQFKNVEVHQLRLAFEEVTGKDLNWFFNEWYFNAGHPLLDIKYSYTADSVYVTMEQKHSIEKPLVYTLPMRIDVYYGQKVSRYKVELTQKNQTFVFKAEGKPDLVDADAQRVVLSVKEENKTTANYIFQYYHTPLFVQRYEALEKIAEAQKGNSAAVDAVIDALSDKFFYLRKYAAENVDLNAAGGRRDSILALLENLARRDSSSHVRAAAIEKLGKSNVVTRYSVLFESATGDSSYIVAAEALKAMADAEPKKSLELAKPFEKEKIPEIAAAVADVYSKAGDLGYSDFFREKLHNEDGFTKYYLFYYYANFLMRMDKSTLLTGIADIERESKIGEDTHFIRAGAKGALRRIYKGFEDKKKKAQTALAKSDSKTEKVELEEQVNNYDQISSAAFDALNRINHSSPTPDN